MVMEWRTHRQLCKSKGPPAPPGTDLLYRWQQRYLPMVVNICGLLAGLEPSQTRRTQHIIVSRIAFQVVLTPKSPREQPKTYRDLRAIKIVKIDDNHPTYVQNISTINKYREHERGYITHPTHDTLHGLLLTQYSLTGKQTDVQNSTEHCFTFNTITKPQTEAEPCAMGYPASITSDILLNILHAHIVDYET